MSPLYGFLGHLSGSWPNDPGPAHGQASKDAGTPRIAASHSTRSVAIQKKRIDGGCSGNIGIAGEGHLRQEGFMAEPSHRDTLDGSSKERRGASIGKVGKNVSNNKSPGRSRGFCCLLQDVSDS